jgi:hypothetical protein
MPSSWASIVAFLADATEFTEAIACAGILISKISRIPTRVLIIVNFGQE